jgi:membrane protein implicated in regulation of membrane protease activity
MLLFDWPTLGWVALAIVAAIVEVSVPHFGFVFVGVAALVAAAAAAFSAGPAAQIAAFALILIVSFAVLRPWLVARASGRGVPSRTQQLVGREGIVTHDIDPTTGAGRVNVGGEDWAARSAGTVPIGARVRVTGADGIVLEVTRT